jgi:hypothetical protein
MGLVRACVVLFCLIVAGRYAWKLVPDGPAKARTGRVAGGLGAGAKAVPGGFKAGASQRWARSVQPGAVSKKLSQRKAGRAVLAAGKTAKAVGLAGAVGAAGTASAWRQAKEAYKARTAAGTPGEDRQDTPQAQGQDTPPGQVSPAVEDSPQLDSEASIRDRWTPEWNAMHPAPLTDKERRFWTLRHGGYTGPIDQDGNRFAGDWPFPTPMDPPAGTSPAGRTAPTPTNGAPMPVPTELRTHTAVQDFAQQIDALTIASDFIVVAAKAHVIGEQSRAGGFGAEMDSAVDELEATARQFASAVDSLREQASKLAKTSMSVQGS